MYPCRYCNCDQYMPESMHNWRYNPCLGHNIYISNLQDSLDHSLSLHLLHASFKSDQSRDPLLHAPLNKLACGDT